MENLSKLDHVLQFMSGNDCEYHISMLRPMEQKRLLAMSEAARKKFIDLRSQELLEKLSELIDLQVPVHEKSLFKAAVELHRQGRPLALALKTEQDCFDFKVEAVSLMSLHASKGLEFPVIFIAGCEDGMLPWKDGEIPEERRLFYVGLTRASEEVFLTCARHRSIWGQGTKAFRSRFFRDIEAFVVEEKKMKVRKRKKPRQKKLF